MHVADLRDKQRPEHPPDTPDGLDGAITLVACETLRAGLFKDLDLGVIDLDEVT